MDQWVWAVYRWVAADETSDGIGYYIFERYWRSDVAKPDALYPEPTPGCREPPGWADFNTVPLGCDVFFVHFPPPQTRLVVFDSDDKEFLDRLTHRGKE